MLYNIRSFSYIYRVRYARVLFFHEKSPVASINYDRNKPHHMKNIIIITVHEKGLTVTFSRHVYIYIYCVCMKQLMYYRVISAPRRNIIFRVCCFFSDLEREPIIQFLFLLLMILISYYDYYYNIVYLLISLG